MSLDWSRCAAVESVPGKVSGAWVLRGTRMPVSVIFENLEAGANIDDILEWFEGLDREQIKAVIEFAARSLDETPSSHHPAFSSWTPSRNRRTKALGRAQKWRIAKGCGGRWFRCIRDAGQEYSLPTKSGALQNRRRCPGQPAMADSTSVCRKGGRCRGRGTAGQLHGG